MQNKILFHEYICIEILINYLFGNKSRYLSVLIDFSQNNEYWKVQMPQKPSNQPVFYAYEIRYRIHILEEHET